LYDLPLASKTARVLAEHATLALVYFDGDAEVINRDLALVRGSGRRRLTHLAAGQRKTGLSAI
jgi:hypothetical protein